MNEQLISILGQILGSENFLTDPDECIYYSQDVYSAAPYVTQGVMRPGNLAELSAAIKIATDAGYALFPRGGGVSYTSGYLPSVAKSITIDTGRMNRILEINTQDMYVTVECGCRWVDLYEALKGSGLRTPFWGTLSGISATVGGSLSQNSIFFGSGHHGTAADSVTSMQVVTASGEVITTGSGAVKGGSPFFRHYGPDLTGLFTGDAGALAVKATITLRLMAETPHKAFGSFNFAGYDHMFAVMAALSRQGLASECFGFDPFLQSQRMKRESLVKDVKALSGVIKASGLKAGVKMALTGRRYMKDVQYSIHVITEHKYAGVADQYMNDIRAVVRDNHGEEIENTIPKVISATPFTPLNNMIGPEGERWSPVHALVPHSKAKALHDDIEAIYADEATDIEKYNIGRGYLYTTVGTSAVVIEPVFFWPDALMPFHHRHVEQAVLKGLKGFPENLEARAVVQRLRERLVDLFVAHGAVHFQIGKTYKYKQGLQQSSYQLVKKLKKQLDPDGRINPGSLGLWPKDEG
ncbi:MAG: FAD-binding protein [Alphaproteobacteria bacterium]|nr:MAG: FAD-binding protein [Alphaproteobacteria bacterium]